MQNLLVLIAVFAVASAKSIDFDSPQAQPIESIAIEWSQVQPIEDSDRYWARLPAELQYLRKQQPDRRIVNGQEATPGQFPYQVFLEFIDSEGDSWCGGSILNSNHVLTAAHCVWRVFSGTAVVGLHSRVMNEPTQQRVPFEKVFYHGNYNENTLDNDIAIVRLSGSITFNDRVQPVRLPAPGDNNEYAGLAATVSGFGQTCDDCDVSDVLLYTSNPILSKAECLAAWPTSGVIQDQHICASTAGDRSFCRGDSGGPVTVMEGGSSLQVGIVSFVHYEGCNSGFPSVSVRVTYYLEWILFVLTL